MDSGRSRLQSTLEFSLESNLKMIRLAFFLCRNCLWEYHYSGSCAIELCSICSWNMLALAEQCVFSLVMRQPKKIMAFSNMHH